MKAAFKRDPLAKWPVLQRCNQTGKCSDMLSACWQREKVLKPEGSMACRPIEIFPEQSKSGSKSLQHGGFPGGHFRNFKQTSENVCQKFCETHCNMYSLIIYSFNWLSTCFLSDLHECTTQKKYFMSVNMASEFKMNAFSFKK